MNQEAVSLKQFVSEPAVMSILVGHGLLLLAATFGWLSWVTLIGLLIVIHGALTLHAMWPRSQGLGLNHTKLPASTANTNKVALTFDDGPDLDVTPKVLDMLDKANCTASFFCVAKKLDQAPYAALAKDIVARGHSLENHSFSHPVTFSFKGLNGLQSEIDQASRAIQAVTGRAPRFFRAPAGIRNPLLAPLLKLKGLELASWTRRGFDTRSSDIAGVTKRLTNNLAAGDILLIHDGNSAKTPQGQVVALEVLREVLKAMQEKGLTSVSLDEAFVKL